MWWYTASLPALESTAPSLGDIAKIAATRANFGERCHARVTSLLYSYRCSRAAIHMISFPTTMRYVLCMLCAHLCVCTVWYNVCLVCQVAAAAGVGLCGTQRRRQCAHDCVCFVPVPFCVCVCVCGLAVRASHAGSAKRECVSHQCPRARQSSRARIEHCEEGQLGGKPASICELSHKHTIRIPQCCECGIYDTLAGRLLT